MVDSERVVCTEIMVVVEGSVETVIVGSGVVCVVVNSGGRIMVCDG